MSFELLGELSAAKYLRIGNFDPAVDQTESECEVANKAFFLHAVAAREGIAVKENVPPDQARICGQKHVAQQQARKCNNF